MNKIQNILGHSSLETTIKYYIGAVEKDLVKKVMQDERHRFTPKDMVGDVYMSKSWDVTIRLCTPIYKLSKISISHRQEM